MKKWLLIGIFFMFPLVGLTAEDQGAVPDRLVLALQQSAGDDYQRARALQNIANHYIWINDFDKAKPYVDEIAELAKSSDNAYINALDCFYFISYSLEGNDRQAAIPYIFKVEPLLESLDDNPACNLLRLNAYNVIARYYWECDMLEQTYEYLKLCNQIAEKLDDRDADFNLCRKLMMIYLEMERYQECIALGKTIAAKRPSGLERVYYYTKMLDAYNKIGEPDTALCYADSAFLCDTLGKLTRIIYNGKANVLLGKGAYEEAFECIEKMGQKQNGIVVTVRDSTCLDYRAKLYKAMYYNHKHQFDSALYYVNKSLVTVATLASLEDEAEVMSLKSEVLYNMGSYQEAIDNMKATQELADSLSKVRNIQKVENLMLQQKMAEYEAQQQYLNYRNETRHRIRFMVLALISLLLLLGLVFLLLIINKRKLAAKVAEEELELRNRELAEAAVVMMKKNEAYNDVIGQLQELKNSIDDREVNRTIDRMAKKMQQTMDDDYYEEFSLRFKQVHPDFIEKLTKRHPDLTPNEIKICSFLRLNMSSKEISALTGQSSTAIDMTRFRIRRKLGMAQGDHGRLSNYLMQL